MSRRPKKPRTLWFQARATWPHRDVPAAWLAKASVDAANVPAPRAPLSWEEMGPTNIGGRMTCAVAHPARPDTLWAGAANGGVWKTEDAGHTWHPTTQQPASLAVGSLALDPQNPDVLYCGTGEANLRGDSHPGLGVFKSLDGGETWQQSTGSGPGEVPPHIGALAVDPFDSNHLYLGGLSLLEDQPSGLFESVDGGATWQHVDLFGRPTRRPVWCHHVLFHPKDRGTVWITVTEQGARNGIWRLRRGSAWEHLTTGLPPTEEINRATLAVAPSEPDILYVLFDWLDHADAPGKRVGVFRSTDGGDHWSGRPDLHFQDERRMDYNQAIAVDPGNPDRLLCGGVDLHLSEDGALTWRQVSYHDVPRGRSDYAHADHHALLFDPHDPARVYSFNDGGMDVSDYGGDGWANRSRGLATVMYYDLAVSPADSNRFGGGTQDNGTLLCFDGSPGRHAPVWPGDGGFMAFDPKDVNRYFVTAQELDVQRFDAAGMTNVSPPADVAEAYEVFTTILALDPANPRRLFVGSRRVWRTLDGGDQWAPVSWDLDGSLITSIEIDPNSSGVYVGTEYGGVFRSQDGGDTWSANLRGADLPGRTVTRIRVHPSQRSQLYLTVGGFGHRHVYHSSDYGLTWQDVDRGKLPNAPCGSVEILDDSPSTVVVASDVGLFATQDHGATWARWSKGLPNVCLTDVVYHRGSKQLFVATYGRGIWRLPVP